MRHQTRRRLPCTRRHPGHRSATLRQKGQTLGAFTILPMVQILILPLAVFGNIVNQWCHWLLQNCEQHIGKPIAK